MAEKRKGIPKKLRSEVYESFGGRCAYCGKKITPRQMRVDHVKPVWAGGGDDANNLRPACHDCNWIKGCGDEGQMKFSIAHYLTTIKEDIRYRALLTYGLIKETGLDERSIKFAYENALPPETPEPDESNTFVWEEAFDEGLRAFGRHRSLSKELLDYACAVEGGVSFALVCGCYFRQKLEDDPYFTPLKEPKWLEGKGCEYVGDIHYDRCRVKVYEDIGTPGCDGVLRRPGWKFVCHAKIDAAK